MSLTSLCDNPVCSRETPRYKSLCRKHSDIDTRCDHFLCSNKVEFGLFYCDKHSHLEETFI